MTYSLNTLNNPRAGDTAHAARVGRFAHEIALVLGLAALVFWLLALVSYSAQDAAFSTSGSGGAVHNWGGRLGAWLADASYFLLGFSAWWCVAAAVRAWLATLARWMRSGEEAPSAPDGRFSRRRLAFWGALAMLLCASTALEWSRLYRFESRLPDHAGGALGALVGPWGVKWLGFTGSGLVFVALVVLGVAVVFRFSWGHVAERLGGWIDGWVDTRREKREMAQDLAFGQQAARQREEILIEERIEIEEHHPGAGADRAGGGRGASQRAGAQGKAEAAVHRAARFQAAAGGPAGRAADAAGNGVARDAGDDQPADREEAQGLRRRGARGAGPAGPGDHALRDRAGHRREGLADRRSGQGPGALAQPGLHPGGRDHPGQELHGAGAAQRQAPVDPALRDPGLAGLQRSQVAADHGPGQGHRGQSGGGRPGQDAARAGGGHHRLGQIGGPERDDPVAAVQGRGARRAPADDRSQDAGDVDLRGHPAPAGAGGHRHAPGRQRPELVRGRDGAALQADEQAGRAQPERLQPQARRGQGQGRVHLQPVQPDARQPRTAGPPAAHRRGDRRAGRPDDGGGQEDRGADRPPGAEGARRRHPPDPGDPAAQRGRDHRPDQGQHPDPHRVPGLQQDRQPHHPGPDGGRGPAGHGRHALHGQRHRAAGAGARRLRQRRRSAPGGRLPEGAGRRAQLHRGRARRRHRRRGRRPAGRRAAAAKRTRCTTRRWKWC